MILSYMTGLSLHQSVSKSGNDDESDTTDIEDEQAGSTNSKNNYEKPKRKISNKKSNKSANKSENEVPCTSYSDNSSKKLKLTLNDNEENILEKSAKCNFEIRRWKQGYYTLITDDNSEIKVNALDLMVS